MLMLEKKDSYFMNQSFSNAHETESLSAVYGVQWLVDKIEQGQSKIWGSIWKLNCFQEMLRRR